MNTRTATYTANVWNMNETEAATEMATLVRTARNLNAARVAGKAYAVGQKGYNKFWALMGRMEIVAQCAAATWGELTGFAGATAGEIFGSASNAVSA